MNTNLQTLNPEPLNSELIIGPTYADYADACRMHNIPYEYFIARESQGFKAEINLIKKQVKGSDTVFICNPNNPTGAFYTAAEMESLCSALPDTYFVIDESYLLFVSYGDHQSMISSSLPNVIILNSILMLIEKLSNLSLQ